MRNQIYSSKLYLNFMFYITLITLFMPSALFTKINMGSTSFGFHYVGLVLFLIFMTCKARAIFTKVHMLSLSTILFYLLFCVTFNHELDLKYVISYLTYSYCFSIGHFNAKNGFIQQDSRTIYMARVLLLVTCIVGLLFYFLNIPMFDLEYAGSTNVFLMENGKYRAASLFLNPNGFAYFILPFIISILVNLKERRKYFDVFIFILAITSVWSSDSRSTLIAFLLVVILLVSRSILGKKSIYVFILLGLGAFIALWGMWADIQEYDIRYAKYSLAFDYALLYVQNLFVGFPSNEFVSDTEITFSDNLFIYMIVKQGIIGSTIFFSTLAISVIKAFRIFNSTTKNITALSCSLFTIVLPIVFLLSDTINFYPVNMLIGYALGYSYGFKSTEYKKTNVVT